VCGLTALVHPSGAASLADVVAMTDLVRHRGPDSEGFCVVSDGGVRRLSGPDTISFAGAGDLPSAPQGAAAAEDTAGWAVLGHRRLSIIDLTAAGHQPMTDADGDLWMVFNGEVYNFVELADRLAALGHRFVGHSDTEVVLAAYKEWGNDFLRELVGMFSLVIVDQRARRVLAARDHFGIKPLYYWRTPAGAVAFASEIKAFTALPGWVPAVDGARLYDFLNFGMHDHTTGTMFAGVTQLGPGELLEIDVRQDIGTLHPQRWWALQPQAFDGSFAEASERFAELFRDSVSLQLRADVPVGSCLSGGLDSSSIVCAANEAFRTRGDAFSQLAFTATSDDPRVDESAWVRLVAERTGVEVHSRTPVMSDVPDLLDRLTWHLDEPFGSTSILAQWTVFELARKQGITVMLDGQGADEQLAGYHPYFAWRFQELLRSGRWGELARDVLATRRVHGGLPRGLVPFSAYLMLPPSVARLGGRLSHAPTQDPDAWLDRAALGVEGFPDPHAGARHPSVRALSTAQLTTSNLPMLLRYEDRDSMAHSVEARVPFLDHRLVEFVVGLPSAHLIGEGTTKRVLREAMRGVIPEPIRTRTDKIGFQTAEERWMRQDEPERVRALVARAVEAAGGILTPGTLTRADDVLTGRSAFDPWVWRIVSTGAWLERFGVDTAA
jgi:asparagine synthase (glutamine-hydrolysing)